MERSANARAVLAMLAARRFGRPVPAAEVMDALEGGGMSPTDAAAAIDELILDRSAYASAGGLLPTAPPLASRARIEIASFARLHR